MHDTFSEKERTAVIRRPGKDQLVRRNSDGCYFEASYPGYHDYSHFWTGPVWFFRCVVKLPDRWWRGERWKRTGEVWETDDWRGWKAVL